MSHALIFFNFKRALEFKGFVRKICNLQYNMLQQNKTRWKLLKEASIIWVRFLTYIYIRHSMCQIQHHFNASQETCVSTTKTALHCLQTTLYIDCKQCLIYSSYSVPVDGPACEGNNRQWISKWLIKPEIAAFPANIYKTRSRNYQNVFWHLNGATSVKDTLHRAKRWRCQASSARSSQPSKVPQRAGRNLAELPELVGPWRQWQKTRSKQIYSLLPRLCKRRDF